MRSLLLFVVLASCLLTGVSVLEESSGQQHQPRSAQLVNRSASAELPNGQHELAFSAALRDSILRDFREHLTRQESRLRRTPLLTRAEKQAMRVSRNEHHVHMAEQLGIDHGSLYGEHELLCLDGASPFYVEYDCHAQLTEDAVQSLDILGRAFHNRLAQTGVPLVRYAISSAYRSPAYQARLRRVNRNASRSTSSHEFGTTYDITYRRFYGSASTAFDPQRYRLDPRWRGPQFEALQEELAAAERAWSRQMAERYASRYAALLGRTLIELEDAGTLLVLREWRQPCYHITVARRFGGA